MRIKKGAVIITALCSLVAFLAFNRIAYLYQSFFDSSNIVEQISRTITAFWPSMVAQPIFVDVSKSAVGFGVVGAVIVWGIWLYFATDTRKYMAGMEHGSARWGTKADIAPLMNKDPDCNIILSATEQISIGAVKDFEADRNKNVIIVGGSGSGKTFSQIKPNLMQLHSSYVITDPKGTLLPQTGYLFKENGYQLRAFNTVNFAKSLHYNPLAYIKKEKDILKVVNVLITNTNGNESKGGDEFWEKCERLLYSALIAYLWYEAPPEDRNIPTMIDMLDLCDVREDDEEYQSPLDIIFEDLEKVKPDCFAVKQYKKFSKAAGKTLKSIIISCGARLSPFDIDELREIMMYDELELDTIGDKKTALFVIMSDTDSTYAFVIAMMMYQMFNLLCEKADDEYGGELPIHVRCMLDEFANIGKIPDFQRLISTIRSRQVSTTLALQSLSQLLPVYKDDADTIIDCCDSLVFLGGKSTKTTEQLSKMIGKTTINNKNTTESKGGNSNLSIQDQSLGRDLIDPAEIGKLRRGECLVLITGLPPFRSKKYNTAKHKRFYYLSDSHQRPKFDIAKEQEEEAQHFLDNVGEVVVQEAEVNLSELNDLMKAEV